MDLNNFECLGVKLSFWSFITPSFSTLNNSVCWYVITNTVEPHYKEVGYNKTLL